MENSSASTQELPAASSIEPNPEVTCPAVSEAVVVDKPTVVASIIPTNKKCVEHFKKITAAEIYLKESSESEREIFVSELSQLLQLFLKLERSVYLEGIGLLFVRRLKKSATKLSESEIVQVYNEQYLDPCFEKCNDHALLPRERFKDIVEYRELAQRLTPRLMSLLNWKMRLYEATIKCQGWLKGYFQSLRNEIINDGVSYSLADIGIFYALSNNSGPGIEDCFAGADIFLEPKLNWRVEARLISEHPQAIFEDAIEPFRALYGPPIQRFELDIALELPNLGYTVDALAELAKLPILVFREERDQKIFLHYLSDGLRLQSQAPSVEMIFSVDVPRELDFQEIERCAAPILTLGWLLLKGSQSGTLKPGSGLTSSVELFSTVFPLNGKGTRRPEFFGMVVSTHRFLTGLQTCKDGHFEYRSLLAMTEYETNLVSKGHLEHVMAMLRHRGFEGVNRPTRTCLGKRGKFLEKTAA